jgi:hypothetical protein
MRTELIEFIKKNSKIKKNDIEKINNFITNLTKWTFDNEERNTNASISDDNLYNSVNYYKNTITMLGKVFPVMILNQQEQTISPPKYWKLSQTHNLDIINMVTKYYEPIKKYYGNTIITKVLERIQRLTENLIILSNETPVMTDIKLGDKRSYSMFDKTIVTYLYEYYILQIFSNYIELSGDKGLLVKEAAQLLDENETYDQFSSGELKQLQENIAGLLVRYIKIMMESKDVINISYEGVMNRVFKLKEKEKDMFTDRLQNMTDEARNIENILKINKLGIWSKGLSKSIKEYDAENYDEEREMMGKLAALEKNVKKNANVTDENFEMYADDYLEDQMAQEAADQEDYDILAGMDDDYNDGDPWGYEQESREDYY